MITIDGFKAYVNSRNGFARTNAWQVILPIVPGISIQTEELNVMCKDVVLPGRQVLTNERVVGMKQVKQAYAWAQDDVSLTFHLTNNYSIKKYFDQWESIVINKDDAYSLNYPEEYTADVTIQQLVKGSLNSDDRIIYTVVLEDAFPTTINAINLNNEQNGIVELNVQLSYKNWRTR
jgi:hypothetical protein